MKFISEKLIEQAAEEIASLGQNLQGLLSELDEDQPMILAYILSDNFKLLTDEEKQYLLYLTLVIWKAIKQSGEKTTFVTEEEIGKHEEANWELIQASTAKRFRDKLDLFFEDYPQEDLLAFVEDALADEESDDDIVTKIGREPIFIALKTIVDVLAL